MKKIILFGLGAFIITGILVFNVSLKTDSQNGGFSLTSIETVALAGAEGGLGHCWCGLIWGTGCKADNYGAQCAPDDIWECWSYERNCK